MLNYEKRGPIAYLTINRPEAHNALDPTTIVALNDAWLDYKEDDNLRCAIITAAGDSTFCAGADLGKTIPLYSGAKKPETDDEKRLLSDPAVFQQALLRNMDIYKPIIAAVNGHAIAGGMEMLYGADIRIAADHVRFGLQEVKWGITPSMGSTVQLARQIPYAVAMEILLSGELISAEKALSVGLVNKVLPASQVMEEAERIANVIANNGPLAASAIKQSVLRTSGVAMPQALDLELEICMPVFDSEDAKEGPRAFMEKRAPVFKGK